MKLEICSFSGFKIYPGVGKTYVRLDSRTFRFVNAKSESLFLQRKNPRKIHWTVVFRKMHKKGVTEELAKKRTRKAVKYQRAIVGATWDQIKEKRNQKPDERQAVRQEAIAKAKAAKKAAESKKVAERKAAAKPQPKQNIPKKQNMPKTAGKSQSSSRR